ncbi:Uncharacterized 13.2 kDa HIT-like protein in hisE 3'region [Alphaproteobacteria bacterium]
MSYDKNSVFAKILRGELSCDKVYEDGVAFAFRDIHPSAPVHVLAIPKGEYVSFEDFIQNAGPQVVFSFFESVKNITQHLQLEKTGYRLIINHGKNGLQTVPHFHIHLLGGKKLGPLIVDDSYHCS